MLFTELGLAPEILLAVSEQGYDTPTPIQVQAIPVVLAGRDLMGCAQTGTGKTAGFTLPILHHLATKPRPAGTRRIRVLVLTPTRELAAQVEESVQAYSTHLSGVRSTVVFGGVGINPQMAALKRAPEILVATPGRLLDHAGQKTVDLSGIEILVLDEADRMLDMGFIRDIRRIMALMPAKRQTLLFSATFSDEIRELAGTFLHNPASVQVAPRNTAAELVRQQSYRVDREKKRDLLIHLIKEHGWHQVLVFTRTKHGANTLAEKLTKAGIESAAIHGNKSQAARTRALAAFKSLKLHVLVATDIAARGLDIEDLPHVVNYELPNVAEDYVHRIGRTGRAGTEGDAVSLVCVDELHLLKDIERLLKRQIPSLILPGYEPDPNIKAEPIPNGRGSAPLGAGQGRGQARQGQGRSAGQGAGRPGGGPAVSRGPRTGPAGGPSATGHRSGGRHR
jgi:ATP-dependent RNA helicase RhlE